MEQLRTVARVVRGFEDKGGVPFAERGGRRPRRPEGNTAGAGHTDAESCTSGMLSYSQVRRVTTFQGLSRRTQAAGNQIHPPGPLVELGVKIHRGIDQR